MQTSAYEVAGVPLYDSAPILYLDDPKKLGKFIKKFDMVGTFRPYPAKHVQYMLATCELSKAPYLAFTSQLMWIMTRGVVKDVLSNPDAENIILDFNKHISDLRDRMSWASTEMHGFARWYRVADCAVVIIIRKLQASEGLSMFIGMSKLEAYTDKLWDHFFAAMQSAGA